MFNASVIMERPKRWDTPFDHNMTDSQVEILLQRPEFSVIDPSRFRSSIPLEGIIKNDCRINRYKPGDIVVRDGDYGNSAFLLLKGNATVVIRPGLPSEILGRTSKKKKSLWQQISQIWKNSKFPETRDTSRYSDKTQFIKTSNNNTNSSIFNTKYTKLIFDELPSNVNSIVSVPKLKETFETVILGSGAIFGEIAVLSRVSRTATIFAQTEAQILEIRWQGLREIRKYDDGWKKIIDDSFRNNLLKETLLENKLFKGFDEEIIEKISKYSLFETYGTFEWHHTFSKSADSEISEKDRIAQEGHYSDGMILVAGGFGRVSKKIGNGERTLTYLRVGDYFGLDELYTTWKTGHEIPLETSLTTLGYLHTIRIPAHILEEYVFPNLKIKSSRLSDAAERSLAADSLLEWAVDHRYINGTQTMLINLDKCVRCDDCVRACSDAHNGNPRFIREGYAHGAQMVANSCMHCIDPVCMIGCPTGAIHRSHDGGTVIINDDTCIGCSTCANSCPYKNIKMVQIKDNNGRTLLTSNNNQPIMKATKCDLCQDQIGGPACVRSCPHDALQRVDFQNYSDWDL